MDSVTSETLKQMCKQMDSVTLSSDALNLVFFPEPSVSECNIKWCINWRIVTDNYLIKIMGIYIAHFPT